MVGGKGLFSGWFWVKMACTRAAKGIFGTLLRGWAAKCSSRVCNCMGFHAIA